LVREGGMKSTGDCAQGEEGKNTLDKSPPSNPHLGKTGGTYRRTGWNQGPGFCIMWGGVLRKKGGTFRFVIKSLVKKKGGQGFSRCLGENAVGSLEKIISLWYSGLCKKKRKSIGIERKVVSLLVTLARRGRGEGCLRPGKN